MNLNDITKKMEVLNNSSNKLYQNNNMNNYKIFEKNNIQKFKHFKYNDSILLLKDLKLIERFVLIIKITSNNLNNIKRIPKIKDLNIKFYKSNDNIIFMTIEKDLTEERINFREEIKKMNYIQDVALLSFEYYEKIHLELSKKALGFLKTINLNCETRQIKIKDEYIIVASTHSKMLQGFLDSSLDQDIVLFIGDEIIEMPNCVLSKVYSNYQYTFAGKNQTLYRIKKNNLYFPIIIDKKSLERYINDREKFQEINF
jgi:hypothetical protein